MALFKNMSITGRGMALYAKAQAGKPIVFTRMQVGSGDIGTRNPASLTELVKEELDVPIASISPNTELKNATIVGNVTNSTVTKAIYICELGLFATDPDEGEILYAYSSAGGQGDYYAPASQGPYSWQYQIAAAVGNAANVTAELTELSYDNGLINSNAYLITLTGGNQKELNRSIDSHITSLGLRLTGIEPSSEIITINHNLDDYPSVMALKVQYGAGMDMAGAGGTESDTIPCSATHVDRNSLKLKLPSRYKALGVPSIEEVVNGKEYVVTFAGEAVASVYVILK